MTITIETAEQLLRAAAERTTDADEACSLLDAADRHRRSGCPAGDLDACIYVQRAADILTAAGADS